jgi:hypothetical protein
MTLAIIAAAAARCLYVMPAGSDRFAERARLR